MRGSRYFLFQYFPRHTLLFKNIIAICILSSYYIAIVLTFITILTFFSLFYCQKSSYGTLAIFSRLLQLHFVIALHCVLLSCFVIKKDS